MVRYLTPFGFLALVPLGAWLGGIGTFLAAAATPLALALLDSVLGEGSATAGKTHARWIPRLYIVAQLGVTAWAAVQTASPRTSLLDALGLTLSTGVVTGVSGFLAAHEMIHSRDRRERGLGLLFLASVFYMQFRVAHPYGHHRNAATPADPASAGLGETLYAFLARSVRGQVREAWSFEARRTRANRGINRLLAYFAIEAALLLTVALVSLRAAAFLVAVAVIAIALLESFNYVAHYGLTRRIGPDGRPEPLAPQHSWNSGRRMNNAALFNMGRHSDHHRHAARSYDRLEPCAGAAELPCGYAGAILLAIIPPLWRHVMDPRAMAAMTAARVLYPSRSTGGAGSRLRTALGLPIPCSSVIQCKERESDDEESTSQADFRDSCSRRRCNSSAPNREFSPH